MKIFTIGPVQMDKSILKANNKGIKYFRNEDFSQKMFKIEQKILQILNAPKDFKSVILTSSGTGGMDAVISNMPENKKVLIINGGTFGQRFVDLCKFYNISYDELIVEYNQDLTDEMLEPFKKNEYFALLCNICETSNGKLYDQNVLNNFCEKQECYLIIDAISSMFADEYDLSKFNADVTIFSSHKGLALAPGICVCIFSGRYINNVIDKVDSKSYYFNLKEHLKNMERGQTPFTPGLAEIEQLYVRLNKIISYKEEVLKANANAKYFREQIKLLGFDFPQFKLSNCITPMICPNEDADEILKFLKKKNVYVNPCGGNTFKKILRISHVGNLNIKDFKRLIKLLRRYINESNFNGCR